MKRYDFIEIAVLALFLATGCGAFKDSPRKLDKSETSPPPPEDRPSTDDKGTIGLTKPNTHLLFAAGDSSFAQSALYRLDLATQKIERLLTGESGDPALFQSGGEVLFFNRSFTSQNYRRLSPPNEANKVAVSAQQRFAGGEVGDPHDALYLGQNRVLLAHYIQGKLVVMEQSSGKELETVNADWDLPNGVTLKPEALLSAEVNGREYIYVVHQAETLQDGMVMANGSQQVFVLTVEDGKLTPVDLDATTPRVQGIKLRGSFPLLVRFAKRDKFLLVSMCSRFVVASDNPNNKCINAVEEVDPKTNKATLSWDLEGSGLFMNGQVIPGPDGNTFFANVEQQTGANSFEQRVVQLNLNDHHVTSIYSFNPDTGGYWRSFYDETSKTLYIGDVVDGTTGKFVVLKGDTRKEISLDGVPYAGAFTTAAGK